MKGAAAAKEGLLVQSKGHIVSDMDGEKVMLSIRNGKYYHLGAVGSAIWEKLVEPTSPSQLVAAMTAEYAVEPGECKQQVADFLKHLLEEGLIESGEGM